MTPASLMPECINEDDGIYKMTVTFDPTWTDDPTKNTVLEAVYQDTLPSGSTIGATVVCMHGSPGSHKDFKYFVPHLKDTGIRVIGINFPGFGHSEDTDDLLHTNEERCSFVQAILDQLNISEGYIFFGHSRGAENALMLAARLKTRTLAVALANAPGLRRHQTIKYPGIVTRICAIYESYSWMRAPIEYCMLKFYNWMGIRSRSGRVVMNSMKSMRSIAFESKRHFVDTVNETPTLKALICYGARDHLIETSISREYAELFTDREHFVCASKDPDEEELMRNDLKKCLLSSPSKKTISIEFARDGHHGQRDRGGFWAWFIQNVVEVVMKESAAGDQPTKFF